MALFSLTDIKFLPSDSRGSNLTDFNLNNKRYWQNRIAHVPQNIYLSDNTIQANIAFGVNNKDIDIKNVELAAGQAQLSLDINSFPFKYKTIVGERGVRLSGGQRQRIGIARALYKKADVIIFDEATSSLDTHTESSVMQSIYSLKRELTIIIIAHRHSTLKNCDKIIELGSNGVKRIGKYSDFTFN